jgi:hypothetical protein
LGNVQIPEGQTEDQFLEAEIRRQLELRRRIIGAAEQTGANTVAATTGQQAAPAGAPPAQQAVPAQQQDIPIPKAAPAQQQDIPLTKEGIPSRWEPTTPEARAAMGYDQPAASPQMTAEQQATLDEFQSKYGGKQKGFAPPAEPAASVPEPEMPPSVKQAVSILVGIQSQFGETVPTHKAFVYSHAKDTVKQWVRSQSQQLQGDAKIAWARGIAAEYERNYPNIKSLEDIKNPADRAELEIALEALRGAK